MGLVQIKKLNTKVPFFARFTDTGGTFLAKILVRILNINCSCSLVQPIGYTYVCLYRYTIS